MLFRYTRPKSYSSQHRDVTDVHTPIFLRTLRDPVTNMKCMIVRLQSYVQLMVCHPLVIFKQNSDGSMICSYSDTTTAVSGMIVLGVIITAPCEPTEYERHDIACHVLYLVPEISLASTVS